MLSAEERAAMLAAARDGRLREQLRTARRAQQGPAGLGALLDFLTSASRVLGPVASLPRLRPGQGARFLL